MITIRVPIQLANVVEVTITTLSRNIVTRGSTGTQGT